MNPAIPLLDAAREVEDVLSDLGLKAVIIGGLAIFRWGEPRATRDVDFTVLCPFGEENSKTDAIFKRHNMKSVGYWSPEDAPSSQNLFIYILEHPSRQEAEKNWAAFQADPEWKKVKTESEADGPLVDHIDRYFMDPTSFSAIK